MPSPPPADPLVIRGLRKLYGAREAVRDLDLTVGPGELVGLLGPNGAGKSTAIGMLATLVRPTSGSAVVAGSDVAVRPREVRRRIGVVFQEPSLDAVLTVDANLVLHAQLHGIERRDADAGIADLLDLLELTDRRHAVVGTLSGGMRRRVELARALLHRPQVVFLDEPTVGLDPPTRRTLWRHMARLRRERAVTMVLTTHYMDEAEQCDRIVLMDRGTVVAEGSPESLRAGVGGDRVTIEADDPAAWVRVLAEEFGREAQLLDERVVVEVDRGAAFVPRLFRQGGTGIRTVAVSRPSLDDVFLALTGTTLDGTAAVGVEPGADAVPLRIPTEGAA